MKLVYAEFCFGGIFTDKMDALDFFIRTLVNTAALNLAQKGGYKKTYAFVLHTFKFCVGLLN